MRKTVSLMLAICGTLLLLLLFATGRLIYTHVYSQDFSDIAETGPQSTITLTENDVEVPQTDDNQKTAIIQLLSEQTYTAYPHFIKPSQNKLTANRLTALYSSTASCAPSRAVTDAICTTICSFCSILRRRSNRI